MRHEYDTVIDYKGHRVEVVFHFYPAVRERGPRYDCAGEPGEPAYVEVLSAVFVDDNDQAMWPLTNEQCNLVNADERSQEQMIGEVTP